MVKKGDTLIEVVLAVGIFSMIAVAVVAVMSGGTSSAQTALETTLARDEIDSQAEALRFIHTSYIAEKDSASKKYQDLWTKIATSAVNLSGENSPSSEELEEFLQFAPENCSSLYNKDLIKNHAFIINYRQLGSYEPSSDDDDDDDDEEDDDLGEVWTPFVSFNKAGNAVFQQASTYPRLVYTKDPQGNQTENKSSLSTDSSTFTNLFTVEGIFIVGVKDNDTTNIVAKTSTTSAFYDFYIRTCWYGSNANEPSTISTVIRLYDPKSVE